eukprot:TRINITY_DN3898_c0_g1_i13.p1 TRINITY_DN3898_c0_g1~~TRINITY_DN3898_c0_g1_i13.p1  ORF type:complete len:248 (-),score=48.41 TRINITY_DN3898_c0_g1_i13:83-826(-)
MAPPLTYFFGNTSPSHNPKLYSMQVNLLASIVHERCKANPTVAASGLIINTCGWVEGMGYSLLLGAIEVFCPTVILVISHERLFSDLTVHFKDNSNISVVKTPKSGGVVVRDQQKRQKARLDKIKEYFYGPKGDLSPHSTLVPFHAVRIFKVGVGVQAPSSALPIGAESTVNPLEVREVSPSLDLRHSVLGVSHALDESSLLESNLQGFVYISDVNFERQTLTTLAPCPGHLPGKFLLLGNLKYMES